MRKNKAKLGPQLPPRGAGMADSCGPAVGKKVTEHGPVGTAPRTLTGHRSSRGHNEGWWTPGGGRWKVGLVRHLWADHASIFL